MSHTHTHTHTDDPFCTCGYRRSAHGKVRDACKSFMLCHFFSEAVLPLGFKVPSDKRGRRG